MSSNTGGAIGPQREALLFKIVAAYLSTSDDERQAFGVLAGGDRLRLLHPAFSGQEVNATEEDLRALERGKFIDRERSSREGDGDLWPTEKAIQAYHERR